MGDPDDVLTRLRAMLDNGLKPPPSRYDSLRSDEVVNKEVRLSILGTSGKLTKRLKSSKRKIDS